MLYTFHYKMKFSKTLEPLNCNFDLPGNTAAVKKRKIYKFHFGNQTQNMSGAASEQR